MVACSYATVGVQDESLLADMVTASRDPFSQSRSYRWLDGGLVRIQKTGGSELQVEQYGRWGWQALDTVAVHINLLFTRQEIPWGYGAAYQTTAINRMTPLVVVGGVTRGQPAVPLQINTIMAWR